MNNDCSKRKDQLLDAALAGAASGELAEHLRTCAACSREFAALLAKREQLDSLLPFVAHGAEPSPALHARILAATAEAPHASPQGDPWRFLRLSAAMAVVAAILVVSVASYFRTTRIAPDNELTAAKRLAEWQAPSDVLLQTPGRELLSKTPQLGDSYLHLPEKMNEEN